MAFAALAAGVSGLQAFSEGVGVIADNITNVNTIGYKESRMRFSTLVTETSAASTYSPGGVQTKTETLVTKQGLSIPTSNATDLSIDGAGMFVVKSATGAQEKGEFLFTRAGAFTQDSEGFLKNTAGLYLMGWPTDAAGTLPSNKNNLDVLQPINISQLTGQAEPTSTISLRANMKSSTPINAAYTTVGQMASDDPRATTIASVSANLDSATAVNATYTVVGDLADGTATPDFTTTVQIVDDLGNSHTVHVAAAKTAADTWAYEVYADTPGNFDGVDHPNGLIMNGNLNFNGDGTLNLGGSTFVPSATPTINYTSTAADQPVNLFFGTDGVADGFGQIAAATALTSATADGYTTGVSADFETNVEVYDSLGGVHTLIIGVAKTGINTWAYEVYGDVPSEYDPVAHPNGLIISGALAFNSDGTLDLGNTTFSPSDAPIINYTTGASGSPVTMNFGTDATADGFSQFDTISTVISTAVDGAVFGNVTGVSIDNAGVVVALFDNGLSRKVFQLPIATFPNPDGLQRRRGNSFGVSDFSGKFTMVQAGTAGGGTMSSNSLEGSTIDLANEFAELIKTQRAFSASTKIITTADEILTELTRI